jgi:hypothetical protein
MQGVVVLLCRNRLSLEHYGQTIKVKDCFKIVRTIFLFGRNFLFNKGTLDSPKAKS